MLVEVVMLVFDTSAICGIDLQNDTHEGGHHCWFRPRGDMVVGLYASILA